MNPLPIQTEIENLFPLLVSIRRELHQHPELGTKEFETAGRITDYLNQWGIPCAYPIADTGIVAVITGEKPEDHSCSRPAGSSPVVALRADMDALPIQESAGRPYHSQNNGIMHACGHDAHMTILLGVAWLLNAHRSEWSGQVKLFFQPAEETTGGAQRMIQAGCMEHPHVDYVAGLHVDAGIPTGHIELKYGQSNAASDEFTIIIKGKSCHGAYPQDGVDAIVIAAHLITSLQTLVSRNIAPVNAAVLTFGVIHGGSAGNVIADQVEITGILRTLNPETRTFAKQRIQEQTRLLCQAMGGEGKVTYRPSYTALINDNQMVDRLAALASPLIGKEQIHWREHPSMGVEDFSFFLEQAPGVYYNLGCGNQEKGITAPAHNPEFDIDENCLKTGVLLQWALTRSLLDSPCQ